MYLAVRGAPREYIDFVFFLGCTIVTSKIKYFYENKLPIDKKITLLSRAGMLYGFLSAVLCVSGVYYYGFRGLLGGLLLSDLIHIGYILQSEKRFPPVRVSLPLIWKLMKIGFPMMIVLFLVMLLSSVDRLVIAAMLSRESLGFFGLATVPTSIIDTAPYAVSSVMTPRLIEKLGRTKDINQIKHFLVEPTVLMAYFLPFLLAVLFFSIHLPIQYFLTKYLPSIMVVKILTIGLCFGSLTMPLFVCFALNKQVKIIGIVLSAVFLNIGLDCWFINQGWGINGVAVGTSISNFVFTTVMLWYALKQFKATASEHMRFFILVYTPFVYAIFLFFILGKIIPLHTAGFWNNCLVSGARIACFFILYSGILIFVKRHSAFVKLSETVPLVKAVFLKASAAKNHVRRLIAVFRGRIRF